MLVIDSFSTGGTVQVVTSRRFTNEPFKISLRDTETGTAQEFAPANFDELIEILKLHNPYGYVPRGNLDEVTPAFDTLITVDENSVKMLGYINKVDRVRLWRTDPLWGRLQQLGASYTRIDKYCTLFECTSPTLPEACTLFDVMREHKDMWHEDKYFIYSFRNMHSGLSYGDGSIVCYCVEFSDVVQARRLLTKVAVLG